MGYRERCVRAGLVLVGITALAWTLTVQHGISAAGQAVDARDQARRARFNAATAADEEAAPLGTAATAPVEALAAFDNLTNGFTTQAVFNKNLETFEEVEGVADGLGPTYNAQSCRECHQNVVTGGASQVTEQRTGHLTGGRFFDSQGGSLIASRATHPDATELVAVGDDIRTFRISTNVLGAGLVEAVANSTLTAIRDAQPPDMRGLAVTVPILERPGQTRIGRFGWKAQHASLQSFAADAYLNEMGITSPLLPTENTVVGPRRRAVRHSGRSGRRRRRCNAVRRLHARDKGAAARRNHDGSASGRRGVQRDRLRHLPYADAGDGAVGNDHQRWCDDGAGGAR